MVARKFLTPEDSVESILRLVESTNYLHNKCATAFGIARCEPLAVVARPFHSPTHPILILWPWGPQIRNLRINPHLASVGSVKLAARRVR